MSLPVVSPPAIEPFLERLEKVKPAGSGKWVALCPAHEDTHQSLSIRLEPERILMKCHRGCATVAIVTALGLTISDLFADDARTNGASPVVARAQGVDERPHLVKTYDYTDADGELLFQTCRFEPKTFRQRRPDGKGGWIYNLDGVTPVLYNLPNVIEGAALSHNIWIVEGEKDADALTFYGLYATTSPMGAGKWRESYSEALHGADVRIVPDNDDVGRSHAEQVAASLRARNCAVKIVTLPGLPPKGDISDWLADASNDIDELESLVDRAPRWTPDGPDESRRTRWRLDELLANDTIMRPPAAIVPRLAWRSRSTLLAAREKSGKSTLTGYIAAQVSRGGEFLGARCASGIVLIFGLEEYIGDTARRLKHFGADERRVHCVVAFVGDPKERPQELEAHIDAVDPLLVVVDSLSAYSHGQIQDDNNATQMASVVQPLTDLAHRRAVGLVIVHHARKADGRARGSTAITAGTDVVCEFFPPDEGGTTADPTLRRMRSAGRVPVLPVYDLRFDGDHYTLATGVDAPIDARILAVLTDRPGISMGDVVAAIGGRRDEVLKCVHAMLANRTLLNLGNNMQRPKLAVAEPQNPGLAL